MRIVRRIPPFDAGRHADLISDGWVPLKEPGNIATTLLASVPIMFVNVVASGIIILLFTPVTFPEPGSAISVTINIFSILGLVVLIAAHELVHLAFIPGFLQSNRTYMGVTYAGVFVMTEETLTKSRFMVISAAPFVAISLLMPLMLGFAGMLGALAMCLALLNALGSSVDLLGMLLVAFQAPAGSRLVSNGWKTYWKAG